MLLDLFTGGHNGFISSSYVITALVFGLLTVWIIVDNIKQRRVLAVLERETGRRSEPEQNK